MDFDLLRCGIDDQYLSSEKWNIKLEHLFRKSEAVLAFSDLDSSIFCCRAFAVDHTERRCSSVPFVESRTCWAYDRYRDSARLRAICRRRRSNRSYDVAHVRLRLVAGVSAPSAMVGRRAISVCPFADSLAVLSAFSDTSSRFDQKRIVVFEMYIF